MEPTICTLHGHMFNFMSPKEETIDIGDIAHALSLLCRFTGHTPLHYSVAQHSVLASYIVPLKFAKQALMHDAAEAYIGDVSSPLKALLPDYQRVEHVVEQAIFKKFGLPEELDASVKEADLIMLATEKRDVLHRDEQYWAVLKDTTPLQTPILEWTAPVAAVKFMLRWAELS